MSDLARRRAVPLVALVLLAALAALPAAALAAGTFWVDTNLGDDANPGTQALPYKTITWAANKQGGPGTTIMVMPGVYREQLTVPDSGLAGNPFVLRAAAPGVVLEGTDDFANAGLWSLFSGNVWRASSVDWVPAQVFVDGARLVRDSVGAPASLATGSFHYIPGEGLYVNIGGPNPGTHATLVGRRAHAFRVTAKQYVEIIGFTSSRADNHGIYVLDGSHHITVRRNTVTGFAAHGIAVTMSSAVMIDSNTVSYGRDHGINLLVGASNCFVQDNESFGHARVFERGAAGLMVFQSTNNLIQRNRVHDNEDSGMEFVNGSDGTLSVQNVAWNNGDHGFDVISSSNVTELSCVAYGNTNDGFSIEGTSTGTKIFNSIAANNGLLTGRFDLFVDPTSIDQFQSNYNIFWNSTAAKPVKFNNVQYQTLAEYSAASGNDVDSRQADPRFANAATGDFHLTSGSQAIDSGNSGVVGFPVTDFEGRAREDDPQTPNSGIGPVPYADRGAFEFHRTGSVAVGDPVASGLSLSAAYPNPGRGRVSLAIELPRAGRIEWSVSDLQGRIVWRQVRDLGAGRSSLRWEGTDAAGRVVAPGMYVALVRAGGDALSRRFALVR